MELLGKKIDAAWNAFAPGKQEWKRKGNYYTPEELREMDKIDDFVIKRPSKLVLSADF